ncbi:1-(5-phosphoribosyl)-5-[(5-phosphoribosylamino)methylideneamino] imidazole-4-carboxamide isomerase [Sphingobacterium multivorum]|uniref:1-(5-phosphoribosyl)-5-[(5-phosphoribosylamino)me thylideneamino] imidazole-4-carboxamide isomerase n=1 Tax=Sphingobacterium multivorum TaxID=28454 RepID=A0A2X2IQJ2_SPHMU|nr:1-(5-phosphoribosyl)-5-[(5-phosphoribosylamino)methylideneamino] imidazole-4-carboxamide isomerase [Sphingobacterium multivorum]
MYIIPAIDVLDKKVVRLREGNYNDVTTYAISLEEQIETYRANGTELVHIIDLNGAKGDFSNQAYLFDIIQKTDMKIQYGGGVRSIEKVKELVDAGILSRYCRNTGNHQSFILGGAGYVERR